MLLAPVCLPTDFLNRFGYHHAHRFVAIFWEPFGDEAAYNDGRFLSCGGCNHWVFLELVQHPLVNQWLFEYEINPGCSDEEAEHWLIVDALTGAMYAAPISEAWRVVRSQKLPDAL